MLAEPLYTVTTFCLSSSSSEVIQFFQPLKNLKDHRAHLHCGEYAVQACQAIRPVCVRKTFTLLWFAIFKLALAIQVKKPAWGGQLKPVPSSNQEVLQKFLLCHFKIGRNTLNFFFREGCAICPATISALTAVISGKQFFMERQKLFIQLIRISMDFEKGSEAKIFVFPFCGGSRDIIWRNHNFSTPFFGKSLRPLYTFLELSAIGNYPSQRHFQSQDELHQCLQRKESAKKIKTF